MLRSNCVWPALVAVTCKSISARHLPQDSMLQRWVVERQRTTSKASRQNTKNKQVSIYADLHVETMFLCLWRVIDWLFRVTQNGLDLSLTDNTFVLDGSEGISGCRAPSAHGGGARPQALPHAYLCAQRSRSQVPILVLPCEAEESEEGEWRDRLCQCYSRETSPPCQELRYLDPL